MSIQRTKGTVRALFLAAAVLAAATLALHWAWRSVAPAVSWLEAPSFGQTVALVAGAVVLGSLVVRRGWDHRAVRRRDAGVAR